MALKKFVSGNFLFILFLIIFGLFCSKGLFKEYAFATHDGDHHISRSFDAIASLNEGYFPLRWAGSLNGWCGVPIFNFFYPLIYYLVYLVYFFSHDVIISLKIVASLSFIIAPVFFYLWLAKETSKKFASFLGAFLYLFVPYRFVLVYVRFSPEFLAYTILPVVLWLFSLLFEKLSEDKKLSLKIWLISFLLSIVGGIFIVSHNFAVMLLLPIITLYVILRMWTLKLFEKEKIFLMVFIFINFIGFSSFFLGPMLLEMKNIKLDTMRTFDYKDHYPALWQLIKSKWDYGPSLPGTEHDGMSFMLGYAQWLILGFTSVFLGHYILKKRKEKVPLNIIFWFLISIISIFLILPWSKFIWDKVSLLQEIQFSWRFLGIASFTIAALAGFFLSEIKSRKLYLILGLVFLLLGFYGNRNHLRIQPSPFPQKYIDYEKNHDHRYATTSNFDDVLNKESVSLCLPSANMSNNMNMTFLPELKNMTLVTKRGLTFGEVLFNASKEKAETVRMNLEYFPEIYSFKVNGSVFNDTRNCKGRVCLNNLYLIDGQNSIEWKIVQSPIEKIFNLVTVIFGTIWVIILIFVFGRRYGIHKKN